MKTILIKIGYLVNLEEDNKEFEDDLLVKIRRELSKDIKINAEHEEANVEWISSSSIILDPESMNCDKCTRCGQWTTNREKSDPILELCDGAKVDGELLCDECLPSDHRWAF